jgi:hypothetical protein
VLYRLAPAHAKHTHTHTRTHTDTHYNTIAPRTRALESAVQQAADTQTVEQISGFPFDFLLKRFFEDIPLLREISLRTRHFLDT